MIKGSTLRDAIISGAHQIARYRQQVDELNVFPVPDGDTGTNMSMTIGSCVRELSLQEEMCPPVRWRKSLPLPCCGEPGGIPG